MRNALAVALCVFAATAQAASPEANYIAARDAFVAKLNPPGEAGSPSDAATKAEELAREELAKQLRTLIGPLKVKGFSGEGALNVGSLFQGFLETGILDGLLFTGDKDVRLVVSTPGLTERWIKSANGLAAADMAPKDVPGALKRDDFYTRATSADAAVGSMGELPVRKTAGVDFVHAMLAARRQDFFPAPATELLIGAIAGSRVYIVSAPIDEIKMMAPCEKLFTDAAARAERLYETNDKSKAPKENLSDVADGMREKGDEAMRKCFAQRVKTDPAFVRATKQAQDIVDALAAK